MKTCKKCGAEKLLSDFTRDSKKKDGLNSHCRTCTRAASALTASRSPESAKSRSRKWYAANKLKAKVKNKKWQENNREKSAAYCAKWRENNKDFANELSRNWYRENREKALLKDKEARERNIFKFLERERASYERTKEKRSKRRKEWAENNPEKIRFYASSRRSALQKRTPPWMTSAHFDEMLKFFEKATKIEKETGVKHHVDHIVPLRGKFVSGLNVPWNLQVIPAIDNLRKNNSHEA